MAANNNVGTILRPRVFLIYANNLQYFEINLEGGLILTFADDSVVHYEDKTGLNWQQKTQLISGKTWKEV